MNSFCFNKVFISFTLFTLLICGDTRALGMPVIEGIESSIVYFGQGKDIKINTKNWHPHTQIAIAPGGPFLKKRINLPDDKDVLKFKKGPDEFFIKDLRFINLTRHFPAASSALGKYLRVEMGAKSFLKGDKAYLSFTEKDLLILDISRPDLVRILGRYNTGKSITDIFVLNGRAYLILDFREIVILDVSNPANPLLMGKYKIKGKANKLFVTKRACFVAGGGAGDTSGR